MNPDLDELIQQAREKWFELFVAGPKRLRWDELPPQIGEPAPDLELLDSTGTSRRLSEFWAVGPALLLFWRHFGCGCGIARADQLADEYEKYVDAGATVAIVGQGDPERAATYAEDYDIECSVLSDPDGTAHETYGLLDFTLPQMWYSLPEESFEQYRNDTEAFAEEYKSDVRFDGRAKVDNPWQRPGEFVVDGAGVLRLTYRYQYCEDYPDPRVLTTAIRETSG